MARLPRVLPLARGQMTPASVSVQSMPTDHPPSKFERRPGPNADPLTRRDESLAFDPEASWTRPDWFDHVVVVLYETTDAVNLGGVVRVMANTGFRRLRLVRPVEFDPW